MKDNENLLPNQEYQKSLRLALEPELAALAALQQALDQDQRTGRTARLYLDR